MSSSFQSIKPQKGSDIVQEQLKQRIESGEYEPGYRLPSVVDLAAGFNVGRSTIREALSALKAMGWLDIRHGGGTFVSKVLPTETPLESGDFFHRKESIQEVLEIRKYIESGCAALAAKRRTKAELEHFEQTIARMHEVLEDEKASEEADLEFHLLIAKASHNSLFIQMMDSLTKRMQESMGDSRRLWFFSELASGQQLLEEHIGIYEAIRAQNETLASDRMMQHLLKVESVLENK
ncbi:FadR/GntR family transcriptional regulator [Paenibacillus roseipurpureus]|uniref:FadR/GntR family transcriptional regulator n=1 Tax=Paenibacillus roseopurpureus TaxID=2918901 RepID=A0AA96RLS3_9BACL|nr:FadR/GntR family transcriptional regulator [Paenibacillus sp. MBLB1832]WNR45711.1 FadR/GntR family transcriptional regulator [Paenibacillus sp. MBLB1832]